MATPRVLILRAPGTNCDLEAAHAFERAGARTARLHVNALLENEQLLADYQILCLPGGFSYGDDIAAGRILGTQIRSRLAGAFGQFKSARKLILGICNGFQILIKSAILLADQPQGPPATLTWNESGRFEDRWVWLDVPKSKSPFFSGIDRLYLPVAHAEGRFVTRDAEMLSRLQAAGQVVLRYASETPGKTVAYPENPNGALAHIAGICDESGHVCGLMPHPERHIDRVQHPRWTRLAASADGDETAGCGLRVFQNAVAYFN